MDAFYVDFINSRGVVFVIQKVKYMRITVHLTECIPFEKIIPASNKMEIYKNMHI